MRILILNHEYPPLGGGSAVATRHLADALVRMDHQVLVLSVGDADEESDEGGVRVRRFRVVRRTGRLAGPRTWLSFLYRAGGILRAAAAEFQPDVIHSHFLFPSGYVVARAGLDVPHVSSTVGAEVHDPSRRFAADRNVLMRRWIRRVIRHAQVVTTSARDLTQRIEALYHRLVEPVEIPWPVPPLERDGRDRADLGLSDDHFVIASLGRLVQRKRLDLLLEALAHLGQDDIYWVAMGFGPLDDSLHRMAEELGVASSVRWTGRVDEADKAAYLGCADAFCLPSDHEGFGLAFVEAMSLGVPVITTDIGGQTDIVRQGVEGLLVPQNDAVALAQSIERLRAQPQELAEMRNAAEKRAREFRPDRVARKFVEAYERAAD
ncbi:MAG: glycosyltransferase family 4 protein [Thermoanaerobaculia bacterium]|nr:glycosyltransferase family 4 protein [Thermoanaerobaculia bacterium]